jgi:hypothetical protein
VRNDNGWDDGDTHWQFLDGLMQFAVKSNEPAGLWFDAEFEIDRWYHLAVVYDSLATPPTATLYINGEMEQVLEYSLARPLLAGDARLGSWADADRGFDGFMREFRLWQLARNPDQIFASYGQFIDAGDAQAANAGLLSLFSLDGPNGRDLAGDFGVNFSAAYSPVGDDCPWESAGDATISGNRPMCPQGSYEAGDVPIPSPVAAITSSLLPSHHQWQPLRHHCSLPITSGSY